MTALEYFGGNELATDVWTNKYQLKDLEGNALETTPDDMHRRLAKELARIESSYTNSILEETIFQSFKGFKRILPQGSPMATIGDNLRYASISNCVVIAPPYDSYGGITYTDQQLAQLCKRRCGVGFNISTIRPSGLITKNAAGTTDGIGVFMKRWSNTTNEVAQKGRRGALMLSITVHHPEINTFLTIKEDRTQVTGANITVEVTDEFMLAVMNDTVYEQRWFNSRGEKEISRFVKARPIFESLAKHAHSSAEPGVAFIDTIYRNTPGHSYSLFKILGCNPCVSGDTWVTTTEGLRKAKDLVGKDIELLINGKAFKTKSNGFFKTGHKELYEVITSAGYSVKATADHKILTTNGWKRVDELISNEDNIVIHNHNQNNKIDYSSLDFKKGYLIGSCLGDGFLNKDHSFAEVAVWKTAFTDYHPVLNKLETFLKEALEEDKEFSSNGDKIFCRSKKLANLCSNYFDKDKELKDLLLESSIDLLVGFLRGLFDTDGSVQGSQSHGISIRLTSIKKNLLNSVQIILNLFGIKSTVFHNRNSNEPVIKMLPDSNRNPKPYLCQPIHELVISNDAIIKFSKLINFEDKEKSERLGNLISNYKRSPNKTKFFSLVTDIKSVGFEDVYDVTIDTDDPMKQAFDANGLYVHNCSEIWMGANDTCRLFGINVAYYVRNPFTKNAYFDYQSYINDIRLSQRLMDDVVDLEIEKINKILEKIESDPEPDYVKATERQTWEAIKETAIRGRRTGLGITAIADCLAKLGKPYSKDSFDFIESLYQTLATTAFSESIRMASERGAFPEYNAEIDKNESHIQFLLKYVSDDDVHLYNLYGRRNIACTTSAPYGSVGIVTHLGSFNGRDYFGTSSGIEPVFKSAYTRKRKVLDDSEFDEIDAVGVKWKRYTVYHSGRQMYLDMKAANVNNLIDYDPYVGSESHDLHYEDRVQMQARAQRWLDHAISSTVNLSKDVSVDVVQNIYMDAWKSGCKGITVYREGSRDAVLSDIGAAQKPTLSIAEHHAVKRPEQLKADVVHLKLKNTAFNMYIGLLNNMPFEVFLVEEKVAVVFDKDLYIVKHPRKASSRYSLHSADNLICRDINASSDPTIAAISRLISLNLRHGTPIEFICEQLDRSKHTEFSSLPAMISRSLKKYIKDNKKREGSCSQCGSSNLEYKEGCLSCPDCGYSKCG